VDLLSLPDRRRVERCRRSGGGKAKRANRPTRLTNYQHNDIVVFMIPPFDHSTGYLPPGVHEAAWALVLTEFGTNAVRF
jgi:hypothetical protein